MDNSVEKVVRLLETVPHDAAKVPERRPYYHMPATLTDSVLQAGMNYKTVVYPRVCHVLQKYPDYRTTCDFIILFQTIPIGEIIQWKNQKKQDTICSLAWFLYDAGVSTEDDLGKWIMDDRNAESLLEISGIGRKTVDYLKLLSGQQAIPVDRHMFQFLEMAGIHLTDYVAASMILKKAAAELGIGESVLDAVIWEYMTENNHDKE